MILSPGCMYAVQRQRYEQEVDKSIHGVMIIVKETTRR